MLSLEERIKKAALKLYRDGLIVSTTNIAELIGAPNHGIVSYFLRKRYSAEIENVKNRFKLSIPSTQILREGLKIYSGNLYEALDTYGSSIKVSTMDWHKNVRIPISINASVAELTGIYWATGFIRENQKKEGSIKSFVIQGRCSDKKLFKNIVRQLIKRHHNLEIDVKYSYHTIDGVEYDNPRILINSLSALAWLTNVLGFPDDKTNLDLPKINLDDITIMKGFLKGVIESSYSITSSKLAFSNRSLNYLAGLKTLFENFNIHSSLIQRSNSSSYRLDLSVEGTNRLKIMGLFSPR